MASAPSYSLLGVVRRTKGCSLSHVPKAEIAAGEDPG